MKIIWSVIAAVVFMSWQTVVFAHPLSDIVITFDPASKIVKAAIYHKVENPETHFIKKVDVAINDKEVLNQLISRQDGQLTQTVEYLIPDIKAGDTVSVEGYCNLSGKLEKELKTP